MAMVDSCLPPLQRDPLERHIRDVVLPLFREVAEAARRSGHYAIATPIVARAPGGAPAQRAPFVTGAFLGLAQRQPDLDQDYEGMVRVLPAIGPAFLLDEKARAFCRVEGASLAELSELRLIGIVREVVAGTFP